MSTSLSLTDQMRYAYVATQHLQHGRSTVELAEEIGVSRFMVGRMIKRARDDGLIEVRSRLSEPIDTTLSEALARAYGLDSAFVLVPREDSEASIREGIATLAARLVAELIDEDDVVGLGPGRTIMDMSARIRDVASCDVVQLTGVAAIDPDTYLDAIMRLSSVAQGRMYALYAPFLAATEKSWFEIVGEPTVRKALVRMDRIDLAVLTVGGWPDSSLLASQLDDLGELEEVRRAGAVAEIGTTLLNADGEAMRILDRRLIGITTDQLSRVPVRVALGGGPGKETGVLAALASGLVDVMVTDQRTALAALAAR